MGRKKDHEKLARQLDRLEERQRIELDDLGAKKIRKLVRRTVKSRPSTYAEWQVKEKCCGKQLQRMCSRCPRRILVHAVIEGHAPKKLRA
ncbi:MAG: hypothetical protein DWQ36_08140 [Acidobacteria bacterium]|nr:MAG: hypothetical protein DWQ30_01865 [Acidobacteriota bacterium]REK08778.1 MAG: hypothetical protein DWQ36_08140 [Acidobacteriota bacterium]